MSGLVLGARLVPRDATVAAAARAADDGRLAYVALDDALAGGGPRLDALAVASFLGPSTSWTGLVPTVTVTHTEPFHVATATQTLDVVSGGRGGWAVDVSLDVESADAVGRRPPPSAEAAWTEAVDVVAAVRALWDSWEDDAVIRDVATGRYIDRERLHYVDAAVRGTDATFTVRGPSIVPRPPQGQPVVLVRLPVTAGSDDPRWAVAATAEMVVLTGAADVPADVLTRAAGAVRAAGAARVLAGLPAGPPHDLARRIAGLVGVDGVEVDGLSAPGPLVTALADRGVELAGGGPTLRDRLGLPRPSDRFTGARA